MNADHWQAVNELFHEALTRTGHDRRAFLIELEGRDARLAAEVGRLVDAHERSPEFLATPAAGRVLRDLAASETAVVGDSVGPYRIVREIGRGGMGAVYLAERADDEFQGRVAVKLIKRGMDTDDVLRRFRDERQILAGLEHPHIARLLDAGTTADGRPYFLMEYVDGQPIDHYCDGHRLSVEGRLELFVQVCAAVSYAHQRLVVHRDIKPSNILVTADGSPKLLDFGVAKMLHPWRSDDTLVTAAVLRPMTPEYASPEQLQGLPATTLGDVYSLGVLLYELLAGRPPFRFDGRASADLARVIATDDPPRPSDTAVHLRKRLRGDLDTIALRALERDRERRYQSADELAADIRRHLSGRPIVARSDAPLYRAVKFVRRNRVAVSASALVLATLVGAVIMTSREASRALRAEQTARAINQFLQDDLLSQASPETQATPTTTPDRDITVRTALDRAAARIQGKFARQPDVEAAIRQTIGTTYSELGLYREAEIQMERALDLRQRLSGAEQPDTLTSMQELGELYLSDGKYPQAEALLSRLAEIRRRILGHDHQDTLRALNDLGGVAHQQGDYARAARLRTEVLDADRRVLGANHPYTLIALSNLAATDSALGRYAEAARLNEEAVSVKTRVMGAGHPSTLSSMNGLAGAYRAQGRYADAETLLRQVIDGRRRALGDEHHDTLLAVYSLAALFMAQGRYADAEPLLTRGLETSRRVLPEHPDTQNFVAGLAELYWKSGDTAHGEALFREALSGRRRTLGPRHQSVAAVLAALAEMKLDQKQYAESESLLRDAAAIYDDAAPNDWRRDYVRALRGAALAGLGRRTEAAALLAAAYDALVSKRELIPFEKRSLLQHVEAWRSQLSQQ